MIPIMRPKLPLAEQIAPYLRRIDASRVYSNFGRLAVTLEDRLAAHFDQASGSVVTVANATLGLTLALAAQGVPRGSLCIIPAWTFVASAHAAMLAGLVPYFVDVEPTAGILEPDAIADAIAQAPGAVGAVMPVSPFGLPIDVAAWDHFRVRTGLPVVIDAAAGFDSLRPGEVPAIVSLHATKVLGVGEGGFVVSRDTALIRDIRARSNFGFYGSREAGMPAINAKLSEYHAAVGHAALDEWDAARAEWMDVARRYRNLLGASNAYASQTGFGKDWVASTCMLSVPDAGADRVEGAFAAAEIETRRWWGAGAHAHPATAELPRTPLPGTERLVETTISLPFYRDLSPPAIERVAACLRSVV
jgi:dTDP-4-amino-4,6-dideoxygalactose transaminase